MRCYAQKAKELCQSTNVLMLSTYTSIVHQIVVLSALTQILILFYFLKCCNLFFMVCSCSLHRLLPQIAISYIFPSDFNNPSRRGMNFLYPAVCVSCSWRESGSNSTEQRARVSGPLRLVSVKKLASLPPCDC